MKLIKNVNDLVISNNYVVALRGIYFQINKSSINICAASNNTIVNKWINIDTKLNNEISFLIKSNVFTEIINKLDSEEITISNIEENILIIKSKTDEFKINLLDKKLFPNINFEDKKFIKFNIGSVDFRNYVKKGLCSTNEYSNNIISQSLNISVKNNKLYFHSTDTFRISEVSTTKTVDGVLSQLINLKAIKEVLKIIDDKEEIGRASCRERVYAPV